MDPARERRQRLYRYFRLVAASCLIGIAFGFYLELLGRIGMTGFRTFEFAVRGGIVGALFWSFEIFALSGARRQRFQALGYGARLAARIAAYAILIEAGLFIGQVVFAPDDPFGLLPRLPMAR